MTTATLIAATRAVLAVSLVPASVAGGVSALLWAMNAGIDPEMAIFPITLANLVLVAVMERILPYRREWNRSHGDLRTDSLYFLTEIVVGGLMAPVTAMKLIRIMVMLSYFGTPFLAHATCRPIASLLSR